MAQSLTGHVGANESVATVEVVDRSLPPIAGTAEIFTLLAESSQMGFAALENGALTIRLQDPATDPETDWGPLFGVAEAINRLQAMPNTWVTVTIDDGTAQGTFAGDGVSFESRGDSTLTWQSDSGVHFPSWLTDLNSLVDNDAAAYVRSALQILGQDIGDNPQITFTVTPYTAQTVSMAVTAVQDPDVLDELRTSNELARQALDVASQDDCAATGMVIAQIVNGDTNPQIIDLGRVLAQDPAYTLPTGVTALVSGEFTIDNATSVSGTVTSGQFGDVELSLSGPTPVFVPQTNQIAAFGNDDRIRLQFRRQQPQVRLAPGAAVVFAATSRS